MRTSLIALVMILLSSCAPRLIPAPSPTQIPEVELSAAATPDPQVEEIISLIRADLAAHLSLDSEQIHVISAESVLWPDTALGCPRSGEVYPQQAVPGYQVLLEANEHEYLYHTDTEKNIVLCTEEDLPSFPVTPGEIDDGEPWMPVD
jgi:hypothetical protein